MRRPGPALCAAGLLTVLLAAADPRPTSSKREPTWSPHLEGPPAGHTGGFGEPTCAVCHFGAPLNEPGSTLDVLGLEGGYRPGQLHTVTVHLDSFDMLAAGFQGSFRFEGDEERGQRAGEVRVLDSRVSVLEAERDGTQYVQHTRSGAAVVGGAAEWTFEWRAPAGDAAVVFHVAANSGSGDNSPLDDLVYARSLTLTPSASGQSGR